MTNAEMEASLKRLTDSQIVQGELLNRVEQVVALNSESIARNTEAIARNTEAIAHNASAIGHLAGAMQSMHDSMQTMHDNLQVMQTAMHKLFEQIDRFIRGLENDGHRRE